MLCDRERFHESLGDSLYYGVARAVRNVNSYRLNEKIKGKDRCERYRTNLANEFEFFAIFAVVDVIFDDRKISDTNVFFFYGSFDLERSKNYPKLMLDKGSGLSVKKSAGRSWPRTGRLIEFRVKK